MLKEEEGGMFQINPPMVKASKISNGFFSGGSD
jgi:hypothetical protein